MKTYTEVPKIDIHPTYYGPPIYIINGDTKNMTPIIIDELRALRALTGWTARQIGDLLKMSTRTVEGWFAENQDGTPRVSPSHVVARLLPALFSRGAVEARRLAAETAKKTKDLASLAIAPPQAERGAKGSWPTVSDEAAKVFLADALKKPAASKKKSRPTAPARKVAKGKGVKK